MGNSSLSRCDIFSLPRKRFSFFPHIVWYTIYHHFPVVKGVSSNPSIYQPTNGKRTSMVVYVVYKTYPLVFFIIAIENGPVEIVDFRIKNCVFPQLCKRLHWARYICGFFQTSPPKGLPVLTDRPRLQQLVQVWASLLQTPFLTGKKEASWRRISSGGWPTPLKKEFVTWDDEWSQYMEGLSHIWKSMGRIIPYILEK